jgi:hypothetical protein
MRSVAGRCARTAPGPLAHSTNRSRPAFRWSRNDPVPPEAVLRYSPGALAVRRGSVNQRRAWFVRDEWCDLAVVHCSRPTDGAPTSAKPQVEDPAVSCAPIEQVPRPGTGAAQVVLVVRVERRSFRKIGRNGG